MTTATTTEKPILFSTELVQAILDGRKTQTRRINGLPNDDPDYWEFFGLQWAKDITFTPQPSPGLYALFGNKEDEIWLEPIRCPFGADELWVRETFAGPKSVDELSPSEIGEKCRSAGYKNGPYCDLFYKADDSYRQWGGVKKERGRWRPSIHMPRWASRIQLKVEDIRVERVQEIRTRDIVKEGYVGPELEDIYDQEIIDETMKLPKKKRAMALRFAPEKEDKDYPTPKEWWIELWDSINADRGYSWESNPWVWVVEFSIKNIKGA